MTTTIIHRVHWSEMIYTQLDTHMDYIFKGFLHPIVAMKEEQDIYKMGDSLWKKLPFTYSMFWIGSLALAGIFPLAGFYSKDLIIDAVTDIGYAFDITMITVFLTALYSWRLILVVFHGKKLKDTNEPHHESGIMLFSMFVLGIFSIVSGIFLEDVMHITTHSFWGNSIVISASENTHEFKSIFEKFMPMMCSALGIISALALKPMFYGDKANKYITISLGLVIGLMFYAIDHYLLILLSIIIAIMNINYLKFIVPIIKNKYYIDEIYHKAIVVPLKGLSNFLWHFVDIKMIDFVPNFIASTVISCSKFLLKAHNGYIYHYATIMLLGIIASICYVMMSI